MPGLILGVHSSGEGEGAWHYGTTVKMGEFRAQTKSLGKLAQFESYNSVFQSKISFKWPQRLSSLADFAVFRNNKFT